jgi:hypothetical protein
MFDFGKLIINRHTDPNESTNSFVGIRRNSDNQLEFSLPLGFESFPENNFNATKDLFFRMYKTFKKFENDRIESSVDKKPASKDNIEKIGNAYAFKDSDDNEIILYSKISLIENLLEAYRDLSLDTIDKNIGRTDQIDYHKIDEYLDKAIYLENDVVYIDEMNLERQVLHYKPNSLISLFCFIIRDLKKELDENVDSRIHELANIFIDRNLSSDQSLFKETTFQSTIATLKEILYDIDKTTAYKDDPYWQLFEAIESFLYDELEMDRTTKDGTFWGINNFFQIWEDMCNTYAFYKLEIAYADTNITYRGQRVANYQIGGHRVFKLDSLSYPFYINFRGHTRWMRPDLVSYSIMTNKSIFDTAIRIEITNDRSSTIDFKVKLLDSSEKENHVKFCKDLKRSKNNGAFIGKNNTFKNYNTYALAHQKKIFENSNKLKSNTAARVVITDWKYMSLRDFQKNSSQFNKLEKDITKQICYEHCLLSIEQLKSEGKIENRFAIPHYNPENISSPSKLDYEISSYEAIYDRIADNSICIYQINFHSVQKIYLEND